MEHRHSGGLTASARQVSPSGAVREVRGEQLKAAAQIGSAERRQWLGSLQHHVLMGCPTQGSCLAWPEHSILKVRAVLFPCATLYVPS